MKRALITVCLLPGLLSGCASMENTLSTMSDYAGRAAGATIGAGAGYLLCSNKGDAKKAACMAAGATAGWAIGSWIDERRRAIEDVARRNDMLVAYEEIDASLPSGQEKGLSTRINDAAMFPSGSAQLTAKAKRSFTDLARVYKNTPQKLLIVGHTDATGSGALNQRLSEQRARAVARIFEQNGISSERLYYQGAGLSQPIASNETPKGRAENRRVEIVEIASEEGLAHYSQRRRREISNLDHSTLSVEQSKERVAAIDRHNAAKEPARSAPASTTDASNQERRTEASEPSAPAHRSAPPKARPASGKHLASGEYLALGGTPVDRADLSLYARFETRNNASLLERLSPIRTANAGTLEQLQHACYMDSYRPSGGIKSLARGTDIQDASDYLHGMNKSVFTAKLEDALVAIGPVGLLKDYTPTNDPTLFIYKRALSNRADLKLAGKVNVYEGKDLLLYRVFIEQSGSQVSCLDVAFDKQGGNRAEDGRLFYQGPDGLMTATYRPARPQRR